MKKKIIVISTALIAVILISVKLIANKSIVNERNQITDLNYKTISVNTVKAFRQEQTSKLSLVGSTAARDEVLVQSQGNGEIVKLNIKLGDYVTKGKELAKIDDKLMSLALERAKIALSKAEDDYNKELNLYNGKASTESLLRDRKIDLENAKIAVEQAKKQLEFTSITAPQNGYIVEKLVQNGSLVGQGTPVARIVDLSQLKVVVNVSEKDVYKIKPGMDVKASSSVYPGIAYSGKVTFVSSKGDQTHNYQVEVSINNNSANLLKAGTFTVVEFDMSSKQNILLIPRESVISSIKDAKVFTVSGNKTHLRSVTIGRDYGNFLEVISGINEGESVVTTGQINLVEGSSVVTINN